MVTRDSGCEGRGDTAKTFRVEVTNCQARALNSSRMEEVAKARKKIERARCAALGETAGAMLTPTTTAGYHALVSDLSPLLADPDQADEAVDVAQSTAAAPTLQLPAAPVFSAPTTQT